MLSSGWSQKRPLESLCGTKLGMGFKVSCGEGHTLICTTSGQAWVCGYNRYGQVPVFLGAVEP